MEFLNIPTDFINELTKSVIALFVVVDPIGNVPIFIALTSRMNKAQKKRQPQLLEFYYNFQNLILRIQLQSSIL
jgi:small neutral amino acid transporter SnatA (MarC family)